MEMLVGMGEYAVSDREDAVLKTYDLASCVAVTAYSPGRRAAGMIHIMLPEPLDDRDAQERPSHFARTGVPLLIDALCQRYGCAKEELDIRMYGGMDSASLHDIFRIARSNIDAAKRALLDMGLTIGKADVRGDASRSLTMDVKTGTVEVLRRSAAW